MRVGSLGKIPSCVLALKNTESGKVQRVESYLATTNPEEVVLAPLAAQPVPFKGKNFCGFLIGEKIGEKNSLFQLLEAMDSGLFSSLSAGILKNCRSTTIMSLRGREFALGYDLCVKRINYKGLPHFLHKKIFGNRARRLWDMNTALLKKGISVPKPVGFLEPVFFRERVFYYISEFIGDAVPLAGAVGQDEEKVALLIGKFIAQFHLSGALHGDLKWENIIIKKDKPYLLDLDQARLHEKGIHVRGIKKDLFQFYRFGLSLGKKDWMDELFIPSYRASLGGPGWKFLFSEIAESALRDLREKGP